MEKFYCVVNFGNEQRRLYTRDGQLISLNEVSAVKAGEATTYFFKRAEILPYKTYFEAHSAAHRIYINNPSVVSTTICEDRIDFHIPEMKVVEA